MTKQLNMKKLLMHTQINKQNKTKQTNHEVCFELAKTASDPRACSGV